jgi:queuine tRNA-ribosyltransferase
MRSEQAWSGGLFAIQQGGLEPWLRQRSVEGLAEHPFDGFAIGGLAVGEPNAALHEGIAMAAAMLPEDRPRYLMGVGYPEDLLVAVERGVDLFDCVLPTRSARTGKVFTSAGELVIKHAAFRQDPRPLDQACACPTCQRYSRGTLRHLFVSGEATSMVLLTVHNLFYFVRLMRRAREAIMSGRYGELRARVARDRASGLEHAAEARSFSWRPSC